MTGYDWRTLGESAGGTSYPVSRPSHHAPSRPSGGTPNYGPPSIQNPPPPPVQTGTWSQPDPTGMGNPEKADFIDYDYVNPNTGLTVGQTQADAKAAGLTSMGNEMDKVKQAQSLANALKSGNINKEQLQNYMSSGILPGHIAEKGGLAEFSGYDTHGNPIYVDPTTGNPYDPRGKLTAGMSEDLSDLQFMQDEGVYGGVSGLEAEVNRQKGSIVSELGKMKTQGLKSNQIKERLKQDPNFASLAKLHGYEGSMDDIFNPTDTVAGSVGDWIMANTTQPDPGAKGLEAVGYDPTGVHTFSEIESDPELYEKYLNRGTLWDDPLSGILKAPGEPPQEGEQDYGYGYNYRGSQRDRNLALLQFLQGGSPIKNLEKSGFMGSMESAYQDAPETLQKGLFSKIIPGGAFNPEAMKRLVTSWGSGYTNPRYANVAARGGIMSAWNNMRR